MKHYLEKVESNNTTAAAIAPAIRIQCGVNGIYPVVVFTDTFKDLSNSQLEEKFSKTGMDGIVIEYDESFGPIYNAIADQFNINQDLRIIAVEKVGAFILGESKADADYGRKCFLDGALYVMDADKCCIACGRLSGKISIVTGSAQGFGEGIANEMVLEGSYMVIADLNEELAKSGADKINAHFGEGTAIAVKVNVSDEDSVREMIETTVLEFGGLDVFVSNAGVLKAGGLEEMTLANFDFVTKVNYTAYFLCAKYAARPMKVQAMVCADSWSDIIQINSKSGLEGSNKNFAYAGGKFGGIGLTQSFALELVVDNIKVNSICPGNFYEGPLWSDPEKGLFVQYLRAGKVPGAKTIDDVKDFYLSKSPIKRGCSPKDVTKAIFYCVEQLYETGQAIPVTGGQKMLN